MSFKNLFRSSERSIDGLTQEAREAIVDVLHFCMYADKHIAAREDEFIETAARSLDWDARISYDYYEGKSVGAVRTALADKDARELLFTSLKIRLSAKAARELALRLAGDLVKSDGQTVHAETEAIAQLRRALS